MKKNILTSGFIGLAIWGSSALMSCTNPKVSNPISANPDTTTVENNSVIADTLFPDTTIVAHIGNDTDFSFLIGEGSQSYMTISINFKGAIMVYWGDEARRVTIMDVDVDKLRQTILDRFEAGDTLKENELFHVGFDVSTPKDVISALKTMLQGIGVNHCELVEIHNYLDKKATLPPPPPHAVTQAEVLNLAEDGTEFEEGDDVFEVEVVEAEKVFMQVEQ